MEQGTLTLKNGLEVPFRVVRSATRKRSYALQVKAGVIEFRAPRWVGLAELLTFGQKRHRFIANRMKEHAAKTVRANAKEAAKGHWCELPPSWYQRAAKIIYPRSLATFARMVGVSVNSLRITSGRSVWGSCSSAGAIALSWRLLLVPSDLRDYVIIHELCHRKYMNHGPRFWALVGKYVPDYIEKRRALNKLGAEIG